MVKQKTAFCFLSCLLLTGAATAQTDFPCATDFLNQQALQNPAFFQKHQSLEREAYDFFSLQPAAGRGHQALTVPVAVHIIHDNGPENISDAQVQQAIQWLNQAFANEGYYDQGSGAEAGIQFCLAQRTPEGQATTGITRDQSVLTSFTVEGQDVAMKNIRRWKPKDYINIWIVRDICSTTYGCAIAAYAYSPSFHGSNLDGIVIEAAFVGSAGNASVLAHEMGHYFGLYHTFEGGCTNNDCLLNGDRVCDTPPDQSTAAVPCGQSVNSCSSDTLSGFSDDQPDMTQNFMDYGNIGCMHDFTLGQANRMNYFLNGARKSLLASKGCLPPCPLPTVAAFTPGDTTINAGQPLFFDNTSQNAIIFSWTLNGVPFGGQQNAVYLFDSAGVFTVKLVAQPLNAQLCAADSVLTTVQVICPVIADFTLSNLAPEEGQTVFITNNSLNASQFEWFVNGVSQGPVLDSIVFTESGSYEIRLVATGAFCHSGTMQEVFVQEYCDSKTFVLGYDAGITGQHWEAQNAAILSDGNLLYAGLGTTAELFPKVFFMKMKPDGTLLWTKLAGRDSASNAACLAVAGTPDGGFAALIQQNMQTGLAKFSADGEMEWMRFLPVNFGSKLFQDLIVTPDSGIIAGPAVKFDITGNLLWYNSQYNIGEYKTAPMPDGGFVAVVQNWKEVARYTPEGNLQWRKQLVLLSDQFTADFNINDIVVGPDGNIFILGERVNIIPPGIRHAALIKLTPDGNLLWRKRFFEKEAWEFPPIAITATDDGITLTVKFFKRLLLHTDLDGNLVWVRDGSFNTANYSTTINSLCGVPNDGYLATLSHLTFLPSSSVKGLRILKADRLGYAGQCSDSAPEIQTVTVGVTFNDIGASLSPPADFPFDTLPVTDYTLTLDTFCAPACPFGIELCNNNLDDDDDGLFDCLDPDCNCTEDVCKPGEANIWYFGDHAGLDFNTEPPTVLTDGKLLHLRSAAATICDPQGNLLFYSDGDTIFNRFHQPMPNGTALTSPADDPFDYECIIVPHPGSVSQFYLITASWNSIPGISYSLIDMSLDDGKGDVAAGMKKVPVATSTVRGLAAIETCSPAGYWLMTHKNGTNEYHAYRIDQNGFNPVPVISAVGYPFLFSIQMKFSPNGRRLACSYITPSDGPKLEMYDFDLNSGTVSNAITLIQQTPPRPYGTEFSPNSRYLYCSTTAPSPNKPGIVQYDLDAGSKTDILNSKTLIATHLPTQDWTYFGSLQLAPNGKIYVGTDSSNFSIHQKLSVIHNPNQKGAACQFEEGSLSLAPAPGASFGLCNFISSYFAQYDIDFQNTAPDTICNLDSLYAYTLEKSGCFPADSVIWELQGLDGIVNHNYSNGWVKFNSPGEGHLIVTAYSACGMATDTLQVVVKEPITQTLDLGPDRVLCDNGVFTFNAGSGFTRYRWQNGSPDSVLTVILPGKYWVDVWDACGNQQSDTVTVSIEPATVLDLGDDREGCPGIAITVQRPDFFIRWQWTPGDFLSCDTCANVTVAPPSTTAWVVVAQTDDGCISVDTLTFRIYDTLFVQLDTSVCYGQTIDLFGMTFHPDTTAQFFFPASGSGCDTLLTVNILGLVPPYFEVEVTICPGAFFNFNGIALPADTTATFIAPGAGSACDSVTLVKVAAYPPLTVILPSDTTLRVGATLVLKAETSGTGTLTFAWSPSDGLNCTDCPDPEASPLATTLYSLQVSDPNGCSVQDSILVTVDSACVVVIPNAFTPNGDGINDFFYPKTDPCVRAVRAWRVASRWGEMVFERFHFEPNDPSLGWDGNRANGEPYPSDVLVWYAELEYYDGRREVRKGDIALLR